MNKVRFLLFCSICSIFGLRAWAQETNVFLDRDFWAKKPSIELIKEKVKEGNDILEMSGHGWDGTLNAIMADNPLETIEFLLTYGPDVNQMTHHSNNYLMWTTMKGNLPVMKLLLEKGSRTDIINSHGQSLLMHAALSGKEDTALYEFCLENGGDLINDRDENGRSVLQVAIARIKNPDFLEFFTKKGLKLRDKDENGNSLFLLAAAGGNLKMLKYLVSQGVDYGANPKTNENAFLFASRGRGSKPSKELFEYFESLGLDPAITSTDGQNVLHNMAGSAYEPDLFNYLIAKGLDPQAANGKGDTPLILAAGNRNEQALKYWLPLTKSKINAVNDDGFSALVNAVRFAKPEAVELLIANGADTKVLDKKGNDLGHHLVSAFRSGSTNAFTKKMDLLTQNGYDIKNASSENGTLMHVAIENGDKELIQTLQKMGLDINAKDQEGYTILHYAAMKAKDSEMLKYLIGLGADIRIKTEMEESVYDLANENEILTASNSDLKFLKEAK